MVGRGKRYADKQFLDKEKKRVARQRWCSMHLRMVAFKLQDSLQHSYSCDPTQKMRKESARHGSPFAAVEPL